jgi:hypothetical protein
MTSRFQPHYLGGWTEGNAGTFLIGHISVVGETGQLDAAKARQVAWGRATGCRPMLSSRSAV